MVNILDRILDSERSFNGSANPTITADRGFIEFVGPDFRFLLLGRSDRGSKRSLRNCTFSRLGAGCHAVEKMKALKIDVAIKFVLSSRICKILFRYRRWLHKYFVHSQR